MERIAKLPFGLAAAAAFLCASLPAQPARRFPWILPRGKSAHHGAAAAFPLGRKPHPIATAVEFRSPGQMTETDRRLEAASESAIAHHAAVDAIQFDEAHWTFQQIACRALPDHLFLRFTRNAGARDRSVFSVSIPRNVKGRLRVIPVMRRGYSLFSPAPGNDFTVAAFNQIRREDGAARSAGWLETALCYAALAGADPSVGPLTGESLLTNPAPPFAEILVALDGGATVRFIDGAARPRPMLWTMTFSPDGTLLKVKREPAVRNARRIIPAEQKAQAASAPAKPTR